MHIMFRAATNTLHLLLCLVLPHLLIPQEPAAADNLPRAGPG
jgi:hypothetical protein